jgi:hypothetical protein
MRRPTIRVQLLFLALAAIVPVTGAVIYAIVDASRTGLAQAEREIGNLAATTANEVAARLAENQQLLSRLAERPLVRVVDPRRCDPIVAEFAMLHPDYTNLAIRDARGNSICSTLAIPGATRPSFPGFRKPSAAAASSPATRFAARPAAGGSPPSPTLCATVDTR